MHAARLLYAFFPGGQQRVAQSQPARISMRLQRELAHITGEHVAIPGFPIAALRSGTSIGSDVGSFDFSLVCLQELHHLVHFL